MWTKAVGFLFLVIGCVICVPPTIISKSGPYEPTWESLDKRPLPQWYDDVKFGIFLHWGVYSVPGYGSEWFWNNWINDKVPHYVEYMDKSRPPGFTYQEFAPEFTAEFFNATKWAEIFKKSNAKYIVLTSKHHEGFTLWPSKRAFSWNAMDVGPHRDLIAELSKAVREEDIRFGLYYSLYEWFNPMYLDDKSSNFNERKFVEEKMWPELQELVYDYQPDIIWTDGDWEAEDKYWKSTEFLSWLYNESPIKDKVVVNDRWGRGIPCTHGDFYTCTDRFNPGVLQLHKWENCMTIDKKSWGFRRNAELFDYKSVRELIEDLVTTVSCGGNLLMNVGPTKDGIIAPIFEDRLRGLGSWLDINGEAIFNTKPWQHQNDSLNGNVWYTQSKTGDVYAISLKWPKMDTLPLGDIVPLVSEKTQFILLGNSAAPLRWEKVQDHVLVQFPNKSIVTSNLSWTLRITNLLQ